MNLFKSFAEPKQFFISSILGKSIVKIAKSSAFDSFIITLFSVSNPHFLHFFTAVWFTFPQLWHFVIIVYPHFLQVFVVFIVLQIGHASFNTFLQFGQTIALSSISNPHFGHSIEKLYHSTINQTKMLSLSCLT